MVEYLLVDLDDTLLLNSMDTFAPPYFSALSEFLAPYVKPEVMLPKLMEGTQAMLNNVDPDLTLEQVFDQVFYPGVGITKTVLHPFLEQFYDQVFPTLKKYTGEIPMAVNMIMSAIKANLKVVIATNPLFPLKAIRHRLAWAGLGVDKVPYKLVASYETFHYAKPNPQYYIEILNKIHALPSECVMVGNDREMDILPAANVGIPCFQISNGKSMKTTQIPHPQGDQSEVIPWVLKLN